MTDGHTIPVGYVHVLEREDGPCRADCPHPGHLVGTERRWEVEDRRDPHEVLRVSVETERVLVKYRDKTTDWWLLEVYLDGTRPFRSSSAFERPPDNTYVTGRLPTHDQYVEEFCATREGRTWTHLEQAMVLTLIDWKVQSEARPPSGDGSDCSDLMNVALARLHGLATGALTPAQVLDAIEPEDDHG